MSAQPPSRLAVVAAFATVYLVWGSTFLGMRVAVQSFPPFLMSGLYYGAAGLLLYAVSRLWGAPRPSRVQWRGSAIAGVALILIGNGGTALAMKFIPSSIGALLAATIPMFITLFAWGSGMAPRPRAAVWLGLVLGFGGLALLLKPGASGPSLFSGGGMIGVVTMLSVSMIWAIGSLYLKRIPADEMPASPGLTGGMQMLCGGTLLLLLSAALGEWRRFDVSAVTPVAFWSLVYLFLFGSLLAFTAYAWLLRVCDAGKVGTYAFVNPVVAVFLGWALAGEPIDGKTLLGAAAIIGGAALIITCQPRRAAPPAVPTVTE